MVVIVHGVRLPPKLALYLVRRTRSAFRVRGTRVLSLAQGGFGFRRGAVWLTTLAILLAPG
jgi:hypothetical protein